MDKGQRYELFGITHDGAHESIAFCNKEPKKIMDAFKGWLNMSLFTLWIATLKT